MKIVPIPAEQWKELSENAHKVAFETLKPASMDRIDFALLCVGDDEVPMGYGTFRELDADTVYWQFGGAFPGTKDTVRTFRGYEAMIAWIGARYKRLCTYIENDNTVMLKFAMKVGYKIVGVRTHIARKERTLLNPDSTTTHILLEHLMEFNHGA